MTTQFDLFAGARPTFPPHLDPDRVFEVRCFAEIDRDHVGDADIGKLGNNRLVWVVKTYTEAGDVLAAETFADSVMDGSARDRAERYREALLVKLKRNSQGLLDL